MLNLTTRMSCSAIAYVLLAACGSGDATTHEDTTAHSVDKSSIILEQSWVLEGFDAPESVILSADGTFLYVSNVNGGGAGKDGNGYIATISLAGELINKAWATGLNEPKGMALQGGVLYVADIDELVLIDVVDGSIISKIPAPGADFLNDVAFVPEIGVLISDSDTARIYRLNNESLEIYYEHEWLEGINGLQAEGEKILITTMSAGTLLSYDPLTTKLTKIAGDMENADGIGLLPNGGYIISSWPGQLHYVRANGEGSVLLDTQEEKIYMNDILLHDGVLYTPNWYPGTVRAFTVSVE